MVRAMLSSSIQGIISQALLKRAGGGRVAAHEIMVGTNAIRNLIRENQLAQVYSMIQTGSRYGMQTMEDSINDLVLSGAITEETAHEALKDSAEEGDDVAAPKGGHGAAPAPAQVTKKSSPLMGKAAPPAGKPAAAPAKPAPQLETDDKPDGGYSF